MLQAIETSYKGYRFRSRLEARWAVFFDALGITWVYEEQGYNLGAAGLYLPDFRLTNVPYKSRPIWVEIKPGQPSHDEFRKGYELEKQGNGRVFFFCGVPGEATIWFALNRKTADDTDTYLCQFLCGIRQVRCDRPTCRRIAFAYDAARSARFEHGEQPNPYNDEDDTNFVLFDLR
mgnify:CR=1 FL=1